MDTCAADIFFSFLEYQLNVFRRNIFLIQIYKNFNKALCFECKSVHQIKFKYREKIRITSVVADVK
jgi:hypothetical protein